jgi:hypothetical protein
MEIRSRVVQFGQKVKMSELEQAETIDEGSTDDNVVAYVGQQLASYKYVEDLKQFILDKSIDGDVFLSLTEESLQKLGKEYDGKSIKLLGLVERTREVSKRPLLDVEERISKKPRMYMSKPLVETSGCDFVFSDRDYSFVKLVECLNPRFNSWVAEKQDRNLHAIPFLADGPGTGKSRFLQELPVSFKQNIVNSTCSSDFKDLISNARYINITFGNGSVYSDDEVGVGINKSLSLRVLHSFNDSLNFATFLETYSSNEELSFAKVLYHVGKGFSCIILGIDEVNQVFDRSPRQFKELFGVIGGLSCSFKPFFVPIVAGTVIRPIHSIITKSTHPPFHIPLPLLTYESCLSIISQKNSRFTDAVENNKYLRTLIFDMGGHCRALEILYDVLMKDYNPNLDNYWNIVSSEVRTRLLERYRIADVPLGSAIACSFLSLSINRNDTLSDYKTMSFLNLEELGLVKIIEQSNGDTHVRIPYIFVCCFLLKSTTTHYTKFWKDVLLNQDFWWQDWEVFNRNYLAFRLSLYSYLGYSTVLLSQFLSGAKLSIPVDITLSVPSFSEIHTGKIDFRFPLTKQSGFADGACILNGNGAPFDAFVFLSTDSDRILIAQQMKLSHDDSTNPQIITNNSINTEYSKINQSVGKYIQGTDFVLLMCGHCEGILDITTLPSKVAIVSKSEFEGFYGKSYYKRLCI